MLAALLLLPGGVRYKKMTDDTVCGLVEEGMRGEKQVRRERSREVGDGGGGSVCEGERWSAGSGFVSAFVFAIAGSSFSACHVGSRALCVSVCASTSA